MARKKNTAEDADGGASRPRLWSSLTYTTRLTVSFALIAAMTALVALGVLSFVWEQHFQSYTRANLEDTARTVATSIAERYLESGTLYDEGTLWPARYTYEEGSGIGVLVTDETGATVWDSSLPALPDEGEEEQAQEGTEGSENTAGDGSDAASAGDGSPEGSSEGGSAEAQQTEGASQNDTTIEEGLITGETAVPAPSDGTTPSEGAAANPPTTGIATVPSIEDADTVEGAPTPTPSEDIEGSDEKGQIGASETQQGSAAGSNDGYVAPAEDAKSAAPSAANRVSAPIMVNGESVGRVSVWVYGANPLLKAEDVEFRDKSYQAMIFAAVVAIVLALCIGFLFARNLVRPINSMTRTAQAIKEGDMSARTGLRGDDEISRLGETFDDMAESVEKDRELERRLTTDVAHELRTPLMAIQSTVEAMVDGVFKADTERLETVNSEVQRLSRLVDALLKLSRLENRSTPMKEEIVDVGELIAGIVSTHEAFVIDSGLTMEFRAESGVRVYGDADMIRQATANLISNAVRYTPEGGHITVTVKKGDIMASIAVKDTGIGLTPEEAKMVFSRFWRADAGRNRATGGLGVGLAVVKEIVDRHGGWVQVEGKPNQGATFTIYIPLYDENRVKNKAKAKEKAKSRSKK